MLSRGPQAALDERRHEAATVGGVAARQSGLGEQSAWRHEAYGYLWWLGQKSVGDRDIDWVGANGYGGQRLYVVPSLNLDVVVTAGVYRRSYSQDLADDTTLGMVLRGALGQRPGPAPDGRGSGRPPSQ